MQSKGGSCNQIGTTRAAGEDRRVGAGTGRAEGVVAALARMAMKNATEKATED